MRWRWLPLAFAGFAAGCELVFSVTVVADGPTADARPFGAPIRLDTISSTSSDDDPTATADLLELYFSSDRSGGDDIWCSTRATVEAPWDPPKPVDELNAPEGDGSPEVSPDGLIMFMTSNRRDAGTGNDIFASSRASRSDPWSPPVYVPELSSDSLDNAPFVVTGGLDVVLTSERIGPERDLFVASRASTQAPFTLPIPLAGVTTPEREGDGWLDASGLELVFGGTRAGATQGVDLLRATRPNTTAPFESVVPIDDLSSAAEDTDPWISPDGSYILFASDRDGTMDIYAAER